MYLKNFSPIPWDWCFFSIPNKFKFSEFKKIFFCDFFLNKESSLNFETTILNNIINFILKSKSKKNKYLNFSKLFIKKSGFFATIAYPIMSFFVATNNFRFSDFIM